MQVLKSRLTVGLSMKEKCIAEQSFVLLQCMQAPALAACGRQMQSYEVAAADEALS